MNTLEHILYQKYNKLALDKKELAQELGIGVMNINRRLMENDLTSLPPFKRMGKGAHARYLFPIQGVARFLEAH